MSAPAYGLTRPQALALLNLTHAIDHADDPIPCREDPTGWDGHSGGGRGDLINRWELAAYTCVTRCPVLDKCRAYQATGPDVDGVLAGVIPSVPWAREEAS